jgi:aminodeoxyfutalosine deaminase
MMYPKIELHVHLEATVRPETLLEIAKRNDSPLPATTVEDLRSLYRYRDFDHFMEVWTLTTNALRRYEDFRQIVVDYAQEAFRHGAVYIEGIFSPIERVWRGVDWDELFAGYCDGAEEAREVHGVQVRLTPDITRGAPVEYAFEAVKYAVKYGERGIVGIGLGGEENLYPPEPFAPVFAAAKAQGLASVPHAGEVVGVESVRGALTRGGLRWPSPRIPRGRSRAARSGDTCGRESGMGRRIDQAAAVPPIIGELPHVRVRSRARRALHDSARRPVDCAVTAASRANR